MKHKIEYTDLIGILLLITNRMLGSTRTHASTYDRLHDACQAEAMICAEHPRSALRVISGEKCRSMAQYRCKDGLMHHKASS